MRPFLKRRGGAPDSRLGELKLRAIDVAMDRVGCQSLADLGAVWAVDAGYSLYALDRYQPNRVVICDDEFTAPVTERALRDDRIELIQGNFGSAEIATKVGEVDAILMFDILLHQVDPDWDEMLELYSGHTNCFVFAGPWWNRGSTVRLLDLGREAYLDLVPLRDMHAEILDHLDEMNEPRGRLWRDSHDIWQWGITDHDLRRKMKGLGFRLTYHENLGVWRGLERFDDCSYVFVRE